MCLIGMCVERGTSQKLVLRIKLVESCLNLRLMGSQAIESTFPAEMTRLIKSIELKLLTENEVI